MQARPYWLQSDGDHNPQWRRLWTEPPWPKRRGPALAPTSNRPQIETIATAANYSENTNNSEARHAAEVLFRRRAA
jgi:hypothetical protein